MKTSLMISLLFISILISAQDNPYCPCQEEARREQELQLVTQQTHHQILVYIQQQSIPKAIPVHLPNRADEMRRINVKPEIKDLPIEVVRNDEIIEEQITHPEPEVTIIEDLSENKSVRIRRTKLKTKKKLFRKRLKKRRKTKRYRGSCPRFHK